MDGLPGIFIPGAISRDVVKQTTDNGLQQFGTYFNGSIIQGTGCSHCPLMLLNLC